MAVAHSNAYFTYDLGGASGVGKINREDLVNAMYDVDPTETPFLSMIAKRAKATATLHEWNTDTLAAASGSAAAQNEGEDTSPEAITTPTRMANTTVQLSRVVIVTGTQQAVSTVEGAGRELARQLIKKGKELRRNIEANLLENNAGAAGAEGTARECAGIETYIVTNTSATGTNATGIGTNARTIASGASIRAFTESLLKGVLNTTFTSGGNPNYLMTTAFNKQVLSSFAGNATRFDKAEDKQLITSIDVYESDFGELRCLPNRFQNLVGPTVHTVYLLEDDYWGVAELVPITEKPLAESGFYAKRGLYWEGTLEARNEKSSGAVFDLSVS